MPVQAFKTNMVKKKEICNYKCRKFEKVHGIVGQYVPFQPCRAFKYRDSIFPFVRKGLTCRRQIRLLFQTVLYSVMRKCPHSYLCSLVLLFLELLLFPHDMWFVP